MAPQTDEKLVTSSAGSQSKSSYLFREISGLPPILSKLSRGAPLQLAISVKSKLSLTRLQLGNIWGKYQYKAYIVNHMTEKGNCLLGKEQLEM